MVSPSGEHRCQGVESINDILTVPTAPRCKVSPAWQGLRALFIAGSASGTHPKPKSELDDLDAGEDMDNELIMKTYETSDFRSWGYCSLVIIYIYIYICVYIYIYVHTQSFFFRGLTDQDSVWQRFAAWWAFGRPVCTRASLNCYELPKSNKLFCSLSDKLHFPSFSIIFHHFPRFPLKIEDHQGSIRRDRWAFWSVRGGGPQARNRFRKGRVVFSHLETGKTCSPQRKDYCRKNEKSGVVALQTHCVSSCKFWRSASCYSEALTAQHTCTDSTQRRHFHYAWKRGMACIMDVPWCSWACLDVIPEIATKGLGDWTKVLYGCYVLHRDNKRDLQIQGLICDCKLNSCDLEYADSTAKHSGHVFSSIIDRCLTRGSTVGRHAIWAQIPLLSQYNQSCITV